MQSTGRLNLHCSHRYLTIHLLVERRSNVFMQRYSSYETWSRDSSRATMSICLHCSYIHGRFILCLRNKSIRISCMSRYLNVLHPSSSTLHSRAAGIVQANGKAVHDLSHCKIMLLFNPVNTFRVIALVTTYKHWPRTAAWGEHDIWNPRATKEACLYQGLLSKLCYQQPTQQFSANFT